MMNALIHPQVHAGGVCYFLCGNWRNYIGPLVVSMRSLRKHYDGEVCVLIGEDCADVLADRRLIPCWHNGSTDTIIVPLAKVRRHKHYVTKASLWRHSPFKQTILLDADTIVVSPIDGLFGKRMKVTRFANWVTTGKKISGRLKQWSDRGIEVETVNYLRSTPHPAVNTGVVSWHREDGLLAEWERLTTRGWQCSFTDELAMQILLAKAPRQITMWHDSWNCSPTHGTYKHNARIWHFHGTRMRHSNRPDVQEQYRAHLLAALEDNFLGIAGWLPEVDANLMKLAYVTA